MDFGSFLIAQSCFVSSFFMSLVNHKNDKFRWVLRSMIDLDIVAQYWKVWQFEDWKKIKIPILPKNSVLGDNKRFGLVVTNSKNSVNTFFFFVLCFSHHTSHHQKITKTEIRTAKFAMKILSKIHTFFFVIHTFAKAIIIFLCVLNLAEWIEKKLRFFRAGITALVAKAFWQWISKIHYFKGFVDDNRGGKDKAKNQGRDNFFFM